VLQHCTMPTYPSSLFSVPPHQSIPNRPIHSFTPLLSLRAARCKHADHCCFISFQLLQGFSAWPGACLTDSCHSHARYGRVLDHEPHMCAPSCPLSEPIFLQLVPTQSLKVIAVAYASLASKQCEMKTSHLSYLVKMSTPPYLTFISCAAPCTIPKQLGGDFSLHLLCQSPRAYRVACDDHLEVDMCEPICLHQPASVLPCYG
jgi:hypothetical protein